MEITHTKSGDILIIRLAGRLDASWSGAVQKEFDATVRRGEHHIHLDMAEVNYLSSAGLGVLLTLYKELHAIKGRFAICAASPFVGSALKLAGLGSLLVQPGPAPATQESPKGRPESSPHAVYEIFSTGAEPLQLSLIGNAGLLQTGGGDARAFTFGPDAFALGIGALGSDQAANTSLFGEFLALAGTAAFQPTDGSNRPDFVISKENLQPEGQLLLGLNGKGGFPILARFETKPEARSVGLSELARVALDQAGTPAVAIAAVAETAGLVGTSLRQSPLPASTGDRFGFPQIRDWLAFSSERVFRDSTSLVIGVAAREGSDFHPLLRPLGNGLFGHFHAAVFPYRPLQKGLIELAPTVAALFENSALLSVLHLLSDTREFTGIGESEFLRGALWMSPLPSAALQSP